MRASRSSPSICPNCGQAVPPGAAACPLCGSDSETGWSDNTYLDGIDMPDDFDYGAAAEKEFGRSEKPRGMFRGTWQAAVGAVVLALFVLGMLRLLSC